MQTTFSLPFLPSHTFLKKYNSTKPVRILASRPPLHEVNPAKLVLAYTLDMHASAVLVNRRPALGAWLALRLQHGLVGRKLLLSAHRISIDCQVLLALRRLHKHLITRTALMPVRVTSLAKLFPALGAARAVGKIRVVLHPRLVAVGERAHVATGHFLDHLHGGKALELFVHLLAGKAGKLA